MEYKTYPCLNLEKVSRVSERASDPLLYVFRSNASILWSWSMGWSWHILRQCGLITMGTLSTLLPLCEGDPPVSTVDFPFNGPVILSFGANFFDVGQNKWLKTNYVAGDLRRFNAYINHCNEVILVRRVGICMVTRPAFELVLYLDLTRIRAIEITQSLAVMLISSHIKTNSAKYDHVMASFRWSCENPLCENNLRNADIGQWFLWE